MTDGTRKFTRSHEWIEAMGDGRYRIGISDYAQHAMGDVVFVDLPQPDDTVRVGDALAECESVKAVSEIYSPLDGVVTAVNEALDDDPAQVNTAPYDAWLVEVTADGAPDENAWMSEADYDRYLETLA